MIKGRMGTDACISTFDFLSALKNLLVSRKSVLRWQIERRGLSSIIGRLMQAARVVSSCPMAYSGPC